MNFPKLIQGTILKRYKRFLADVELENGDIVIAHCANSGKMTSCWQEGWKVWLSYHDDPKRKLKYSWQLSCPENAMICVNTHLANTVVGEALRADRVSELTGYQDIRAEVKYGEKSRVDFLLTRDDEKCYVEVKSVTLLKDNIYQFPDTVTTRGQKHLQELIEMKKQGHRAVMLFAILRQDKELYPFKAADELDPKYAELLEKAKEAGVECLVYHTEISEESIRLVK